MQRSIKAAVAITMVFAAPAPAQAATGEGAPIDVRGCWALETEKLPLVPAMRPKAVMICFSDAAPGDLNMRVEIVDPTGAATVTNGRLPLDGTPSHPDRMDEADTGVTRAPTPGVLVLALAKDGHMASTRVYAVSADGKAMVETVVYYPAGGASTTRLNYFKRATR